MAGTVLRDQSSLASAWYTVAYFFQSIQTWGWFGVLLCVLYAYVLRVWSDGTRPPPVFHLTWRKVVCVFRLYLRDSVKVELQSGQEKDNNLELASQQT